MTLGSPGQSGSNIAFSYPDKTVLVVGGSGDIGRTVVQKFGAAGAKVAIHFNSNRGKAEDLADQIDSSGERVMLVQADLSDESQVTSMIKQVTEQWKRLDVLVNCAGIARDGVFATADFTNWDDVFSVNLRGSALTTRAALRPMIRQRGGVVINIASYSGLKGRSGQANYAASKAGLINFTASIAAEYGPKGIRAVSVAPGPVRGEMWGQVPAEKSGEAVARIPLGRIAEPEEIANLVAFMASEEARYITGVVVPIDGGLSVN